LLILFVAVWGIAALIFCCQALLPDVDVVGRNSLPVA
jgi:hypothetical protein